MARICIIDTSVFCNILKVPKKSQKHDETLLLFQKYLQLSYTFLLPMATIYETGNHIAQNGDGQRRRQIAEIFVDQVQNAFLGKSPWVPTPFDAPEEFSAWLSLFPDEAMREIGVGDLSIIKVFERECERHPSGHIFIWSYDNHLSAYNREA